MAGENKVLSTKSDMISFINNSSENEFHTICTIFNDYLDRKKAEAEFFKQMNVAEESIKNEGTVSSSELRATLGI